MGDDFFELGIRLDLFAAGNLLFKLGHEDGGEDTDDAQADSTQQTG